MLGLNQFNQPIYTFMYKLDILSIGIPFDDAYDLSQSIRDELKNKPKISSSDLQILVSSALIKRFGHTIEMAYIDRHLLKTDIIVAIFGGILDKRRRQRAG